MARLSKLAKYLGAKKKKKMCNESLIPGKKKTGRKTECALFITLRLQASH